MDSLATDCTLVQALVQLGPEITGNRDVTRAMLARFGISESSPPLDEQVVEVVLTLAKLASEGTVLCDVGTLVKVLSDLVSWLSPAISGWYCADCRVEHEFGLGKRHHVV